MKQDETFQEIDDLLRSQQPDPFPSPGLEFRILRAVDQQQHRASKRWWPWLALPPALAAAILMLAHRSPVQENSTPVIQAIVSVEPPVEPILSQMMAGNPLKDETHSLGRDAERAGNFLINCLPSIGSE